MFKEMRAIIRKKIKAVQALKPATAKARAERRAILSQLDKMKDVFTRFGRLLGRIEKLSQLEAGKDGGARLVKMRASIEKEIGKINSSVKTFGGK